MGTCTNTKYIVRFRQYCFTLDWVGILSKHSAFIFDIHIPISLIVLSVLRVVNVKVLDLIYIYDI